MPTPKPAPRAREAFEVVGGVVALFAIDRGVRALFSWVGFAFPSAVAGMLLCFALLALGRTLLCDAGLCERRIAIGAQGFDRTFQCGHDLRCGREPQRRQPLRREHPCSHYQRPSIPSSIRHF